MTIQVVHVDFIGKKIGQMKKTDEGYLIGNAPIAKVGVMSYLLSDGSIIKEFVSEDTLFEVESMESLKLKPMTDTHPSERTLDSKTVKRRKVGFTGEIINKKDSFLVSSMIITDDDAIINIGGGRQELSPGYTCELDMVPGEFNGEHYDAIQLKRRYNHVAICDKARGGNELKLHLDSVDNVDGFEINSKKITIKRKEKPMPIFKIDGIEYEAAQEVINHITKLDTDYLSGSTELQKQLDKETVRADTAEGERDTYKTKVDELEKIDLSAEIVKGVKERSNILDFARVVLDKEEFEKLDGVTNDEIKKLIITKKNPNINFAEKADAYVDGMYDTIIATLDTSSVAKQRRDAAIRTDGALETDLEKIKKDSEDKIKNSYKDFGKDK